MLAASVVLAWVTNGTRGGILIAMLLHALNSAIRGGFISPLFTGAGSVRQAWLLAALWCVAAVVITVATLALRAQKNPEPAAGSTPRREIGAY